MELKAETLIKWLEITKRRDLGIPIAYGVDSEIIKAKMFSNDYMNSGYKEWLNVQETIDTLNK